MKKIQNCSLKTEHKPYDCLYWAMMVLPVLVIACVSIARVSYDWLGIYAAVFVISQILIFKFLCTRCPHYCKEGKLLRCMFLWNVPKIFKPRSGKWNLMDKIIIPLAMTITLAFPIYWVWQDKLLFAIYIISGINFMLTLKKYECSRCTYFHCPNNSVPKEIKNNL